MTETNTRYIRKQNTSQEKDTLHTDESHHISIPQNANIPYSAIILVELVIITTTYKNST